MQPWYVFFRFCWENSRVFEKLRRYSEEKVSTYGAQYWEFGAFFFLFFVFKTSRLSPPAGPYSYTGQVILRVLAILLVLGVLSRKYWPQRIKAYWPLFWHFTLFYCLPFRTTFNILYLSHVPAVSIFDRTFGILILPY